MKNVSLPLAGMAAALIGAASATAVYSNNVPRLPDAGALVVPVQQPGAAGGRGKQDDKGGGGGAQMQGGQGGSSTQKGAGGGGEPRESKGIAKDSNTARGAEKGKRSQSNVEVRRDRERRSGANVRFYTDGERRRGRDTIGVAPGRIYGYSAGGCENILQRYRACMRGR
jgi:hypothetical protein